MKKLSIKMRITLWYCALMTLLLIAVMGVLLFVSQYVVQSDAQENLVATVELNRNEVEFDDGELDIDDDFLYFSEGVTSLIYASNGTLLSGQLPQNISQELAFEDSKMKTIASDLKQYYVYDRRIDTDQGEGLWVRGIIAADGASNIVTVVLVVAGITLPLVVIVGAILGYQITKRSFKPVDAITQAANEISEGSDLSRRIQLGEGRDEIHKLASTFNHMFSRLEASFEQEKQFTSDVSHELRTPTSVIMSQCEYALDHVNNEEEYREAIVVIKRQVDKMSELIEQLLTFTRMERGIEKIHKERINLSELVENICWEQSVKDDKEITLIQNVPKGIEAVVDRSLISRLLSNLMNNAYQYTNRKGTIWVILRQEGLMVQLTVADNGIGISRENLSKVWDRFYQVDPSRAPSENGSMGLGLAMVNQIAHLHGGCMDIASELGKGTTLVFTFASGIYPCEGQQDPSI